MKSPLIASLLVSAVLPATVSAQLARQSQLTAKDADPTFQLTLEHLALDVRWLGLPPREVAWSPDGERVYFRWREDPKADQNPETDPWYAVDRAGTKLNVVPPDEVKRIPSSNLTWSANRKLAAWSRAGTLFVWTRDKGVRPVYTALSELGDLHVASDGSGAFFATKGFQNQSEESADLWFYDVAAGHLRQVAAVNEKKEDKAEKEKEAKWLKEQQLELVEIVRKRKEDKETADAARRDREPFRPQVVLIEKGARLQLQAQPGRAISDFLVDEEALRRSAHSIHGVRERKRLRDREDRAAQGRRVARRVPDGHRSRRPATRPRKGGDCLGR
jgi:hypothetical protein